MKKTSFSFIMPEVTITIIRSGDPMAKQNRGKSLWSKPGRGKGTVPCAAAPAPNCCGKPRTITATTCRSASAKTARKADPMLCNSRGTLFLIPVPAAWPRRRTANEAAAPAAGLSAGNQSPLPAPGFLANGQQGGAAGKCIRVSSMTLAPSARSSRWLVSTSRRAARLAALPGRPCPGSSLQRWG